CRAAHVDPPAEQTGNDSVDEGHAEPAASRAHPGGEERIEDPVEMLRRNAAPAVGDRQHHALAIVPGFGADSYGARIDAVETVHHRIVEAIEDDVAVRAGVAVQHDARLDLHFGLVAGASQLRTQRRQHLLDGIAEVETPALRAGLVDRDLL